ncbi:hypothetical protein ACMFMG_005149 [Clarireedia jacksonii]
MLEGDNFWVTEQTEVARSLPPNDILGRYPIDFDWKVFRITGYVDTNTYEIGVSVSIIGITVGNIYGNLKDGVGLRINLFLVKGELKFYLKNGNELWIRVDIDIKFDGGYHENTKITSF